jgi:hypothetical protein
MEKQNDQQSDSKIITEEQHLEKLVEESDFFTSLFQEILLPTKKYISVFEAYRELKKLSEFSNESSHHSLDFRIVKKPSWNKLWDIELCFKLNAHSNPLIEAKEISCRGYLSCHRRGTFITYALWVNGKERWFDSFELACALLDKVMRSENIDEILPTI